MQGFREFYLTEEFDSISAFLLNPENRNKTWQQLMSEFEAEGGEYIGGGKFGTVFDHPKWPYVLKMFDDPHYLRFVRFAYRNPHRAFPKFYGPPQKIVPYYKRTPERATTYIVRVERLQPVSNQTMLQEIVKFYDRGVAYIMAKKQGVADTEDERMVLPSFKERRQGIAPSYIRVKRYQDQIDFIKKYPQSESLFEAIYIVQMNLKETAMDIHTGNIMQRSNNDLVLIDPVWEGSNPYADYQAMLDAETDRWGGGEYEPEPTLVGGKLPTKKRIWRKNKKAAAAARRQIVDDVPF